MPTIVNSQTMAFGNKFLFQTAYNMHEIQTALILVYNNIKYIINNCNIIYIYIYIKHKLQ